MFSKEMDGTQCLKLDNAEGTQPENLPENFWNFKNGDL